MDQDAPIVTIIGGSGFVGRYIAWHMARRGWRVRVACRRPNTAGFVRAYGVVGQVEPVQCNIRDDASVAAVMRASDVVVFSVGVLADSGKNTFEAVQAEGAARSARLAAAEGVERFVKISAIGADHRSPARYGRTKAQGEDAVLEHFPEATILRPSVVFGAEDQFFNRFASMARLSPVIPIVGGATRFQPVYVGDVAEAAAKACAGEVEAGTYELGGPTVYTFREIVELTLRVIRRRRFILDMPFWLGYLQGRVLKYLPNPPITDDQVALLERDNVVSKGARGFKALGIEPAGPEGIIERYLVRFRPRGQYDEMIESARGRKS
ncbi:MAG: complex I NDUFA9 subunit family protein [Paracoccaceae bacterium]